MKNISISIKEFKNAQKIIDPWILKTPLHYSQFFSNHIGSKIYLKMENKQKTGSFKIRGALNKILSLTSEEKSRGLISCSAGNHAQGVAYAAQCVKTSATIVLPTITPVIKQKALAQYKTKVILHGDIYDESYNYAIELAKKNNNIFIHAYLDPKVIAGQGSIALEILNQIQDLDSVIVPIGGGGLISGIACVIKQLKPSCRIYGVVSNVAPAMKNLFHNITTDSKEFPFRTPYLADGIIVKKPNQNIFKKYISKYVDDIISVTDAEIASTIMLLLEQEKTLTEGAGAAALTALLKQYKIWDIGKKCTVILSGGNIDSNCIKYLKKIMRV